MDTAPSAGDDPDAPLVEAVHVSYRLGSRECLRDICLTLRSGDRCLLTGDNGSGKSTLLRVLAGRHIPTGGSLRLLGSPDAFSPALNRDCSLIESNWGQRTVAFAGYSQSLLSDLPVSNLMNDLQREFPLRCDRLLRLLRICPEWRVHQLSDGQRRRVQLFLGLLRPFRLLLLDEVTSDLDVVTRADLLHYLIHSEPGAAIVYATHILDGTEDWGTRLLFLDRGTLRRDFQPPFPPLRRALEDWIREARRGDSDPEAAEAPGREGEGSGGYRPGRSGALVASLTV